MIKRTRASINAKPHAIVGTSIFSPHQLSSPTLNYYVSHTIKQTLSFFIDDKAHAVIPIHHMEYH